VLENCLYKNEHNWQLHTSIQVQKKIHWSVQEENKNGGFYSVVLFGPQKRTKQKIKEWYKERLLIIHASTLPLIAINCLGC
jgi:hypothetical protein